MAANYIIERSHPEGQTHEIAFAGDGVRLAGQIDYPSSPPKSKGYPLLFILPHAGWNTRQDHRHYVHTALNVGYAVFRWDRRGTGRSGSGGWGSTTQDAVNAYETALAQTRIDLDHVVILAQGEGTLMLGESFGLFARLGRPSGVVLAANMLDSAGILAIDAPVRILQGERDWNDWQKHAREAAQAHNGAYAFGADYHLISSADRDLMIEQNGMRVFHFGAAHKIRDWLKNL